MLRGRVTVPISIDTYKAGVADAALARIRPVGEIAPLAEAQLVIEAATEREGEPALSGFRVRH